MLKRKRGKFKAEKCMFRGVILSTILFLAAGTAPADAIRISWDPETVIRGSVVLVHVKSPLALKSAQAAVGEERFPLILADEGQYHALVGIDLNQEGLILPVDFSLLPARGVSPYRIRADLKIVEKVITANQQHLSLPTGMVDFSQKRLQEIHQDNENLRDALKTRTPLRFWKESFLMPVSGRITTRFGTGRVLNGKQRSPHSGVDIAGKTGTPVRASNGGRVILVDSFFLSGNTVVVDHGWGVSTIYAHLDGITVSEGQKVERDQILGTVGSTGRATGPHLHFGALIRGVKVDPLRLIEVTRNFDGGSGLK